MNIGAINANAGLFSAASRHGAEAAAAAAKSHALPAEKPGFSYDNEGQPRITAFKLYGANGKVQVFYQNVQAESPVAALDDAARVSPQAALYKSYGADGSIRLLNQNGAAVADSRGENSANPAAKVNPGSEGVLNTEKTTECKTCAERQYQDKSSDPGVSFQVATHISPSVSVAMVASHEREHETREAADAEENGQQVVKSDVRIFMAQCPECKRMYATGGLTTVQKADKQPTITEQALEQLSGQEGEE